MWRDGCSPQFRSKYVFASMTQFDKLVQLEWHYNEAHHGDSPMYGVDETIKRVVFVLLKSEKITINTAEQFATKV